MRFHIILIATTIALVFQAQAESKTDPKSSSTRTCRIIFPERAKDAPKAAYLYDGKKNHQVRLPSANFSKVIELPRGELTVLMSPTEITDPTVLPPATTQLKVEESVQDFYILVSSDPTHTKSPLKFRLIDASDDKLKRGGTLWTNLTDHQIVAKLGNKEMTIKPMSETVSNNPVSSSGYYRAEFSYQPHAEGETYKITEQQWWHDANSKHIGFIVDSGGRLPKIYFYRDFRL
jgi:hypothetical protein